MKKINIVLIAAVLFMAGNYGHDLIWVKDSTGNITYTNGDVAMDTNTLFVDASTDYVGIGTATPKHKLDIGGIADMTITGTDGVDSTKIDSNSVEIYNSSNGYIHIGNDSTTIYKANNNYIVLRANSNQDCGVKLLEGGITGESGITFFYDGSANSLILKDEGYSDIITLTRGGYFIINQTKTPAAANATGTAGSIAWDANYIYVCTATDTWKRVGISSW